MQSQGESWPLGSQLGQGTGEDFGYHPNLSVWEGDTTSDFRKPRLGRHGSCSQKTPIWWEEGYRNSDGCNSILWHVSLQLTGLRAWMQVWIDRAVSLPAGQDGLRGGGQRRYKGKETCKACSLGDMVLNKPQPLSHLTLCTSQASSWDSEQRSSNQRVEQVWVCLLPGQPLHQKRQRCPLSPIDMGHWSSRVQMWQSRTGEWQNRGQVSWKLLESGWKVIFLPLRFY